MDFHALKYKLLLLSHPFSLLLSIIFCVSIGNEVVSKISMFINASCTVSIFFPVTSDSSRNEILMELWFDLGLWLNLIFDYDLWFNLIKLCHASWMVGK